MLVAGEQIGKQAVISYLLISNLKQSLLQSRLGLQHKLQQERARMEMVRSEPPLL